jgi:hypothetical protein
MNGPTSLEQADFASLYRRAFEEFGASGLWSSKLVIDPTRWRSRIVCGLKATVKFANWRRK